jgi:thymidine phosphorylase
MVLAQGGTLEHLPSLARTHEFKAQEIGTLGAVDCYPLGMAVIALGGGRSEVGQALNHRVGLKMVARVGDYVDKGSVLCEVYSDSEEQYSVAKQWLVDAYKIT